MVHAIAEVVSHWLPAVEAGFHPGSVQLGFMLDSLAMGQVFLEILCFSPVIIAFMLYSHVPSALSIIVLNDRIAK